MEQGLTKNRILTELSRSAHGKLSEYILIGQQATKQEPEFMAHLIAWDRLNGQVRDAKVALPVVSLSMPGFSTDLAENSLAHLALLGPRELLQAYRFAMEIKLPGRMRTLRRLIAAFLKDKEANWPKFQRIALQHRHTLKELYSLAHLDCGDKARAILYGKDSKTGKKLPLPHGSVFELVARLKDMSPEEAAGVIMERKIPFLIAKGALGKKAQDPELVLALLKVMSPTEVVTNTKALEKMGVKTNPALRGAFEEALEKASNSSKNVLKTTRAAEAVDDEELKEKLRGVQERQIQKMGGVDGNWLVLGDRSPSMSQSVEVAKHVASTLAGMVKGKVWLVFFDSTPQTIEVSGLSLDQINKATKHIQAGGSGTSIGCGLQRMLDSKSEIDGVAIVSDGGENTSPRFATVHKEYERVFGKNLPVYLYLTTGDTPNLIRSMEAEERDMQVFDLRTGKVDYYSIPNLVKTMRTNRYSLIDEVMETRLLTLKDVFKTQKEEVQVLAGTVS